MLNFSWIDLRKIVEECFLILSKLRINSAKNILLRNETNNKSIMSLTIFF